MWRKSLGLVVGSWLVLVCTGSAWADATIDVDGDLSDWPADAFTFLDNAGDFPPPWTDIEQVWVTDDNSSGDDGNLYVALDFTSRFRDHIGSNDVDLYVYLDVDGDGSIGGPLDRIIELTEGVITDGDGNVVGTVAEMDYSGDTLEAAIPYSVLGLTAGSDTFGISFAASGKPNGAVDASPNEGDGFIEYDGTQSPEPTAVRMAGVSVRTERGGNRVMWSTGAERSNLGFEVYRLDERGRRTRLDDALVPGLLHAPLGRTYSFFDPGGRPTDRYQIVDVSLAGQRTIHGPVRARAGAQAPPDVRPQPANRIHTALPRSLGRPAPAATSHGAPIELAVDTAGPILVGDALLEVAGLDRPNAKVDPLITRGGHPVPSLPWPGGRLLLGIPQVDRHADYEVLLLHPTKRAKPMPTRGVIECGPAIGSAPVTLRASEDHTYLVMSLGLDPFFWASVFTGFPAELALQVQAPEPRSATLTVELVGLAATHRVEVRLNGNWLGEAAWSGGHLARLRFDVPTGALVSGENTVEVRLPADTGYDALFIEALDLDYTRRLSAPSGQLAFTARAGSCLEIDGLLGHRPALLDVTDPAQPVRLTGFELAPTVDGTRSLRFAETGGVGQRRYLVVDETAELAEPELLGPLSARHFDRPGLGADVLIISHPSLVSQARRLAAVHDDRGLTSLVVTTTEAYDAFTGGRKSPAAIRALIRTALERWRAPPRFVLLFGSASFDPRGLLPDGKPDLVPSPFVVTVGHGYEAASDAWYAAGPDGLTPLMAIGRLAVRNQAEAEAVVDKLQRAGHQPKLGRVGLVADDRDPVAGPTDRYERAASALVDTCLPASTRADLLFKADSPDPQAAVAAMLDEGLDALTYHGHAFLTGWSSGPTLLTSPQAASLENDHLFALLSFTCFDGAHVGPWGDALAWELMANPAGGACLALASTSLSDPDALALLAEQLICRLTSGRAITVGEALADAARDLAGLNPAVDDALRTYVLLGDPTWPSPFQTP